MIGSIVLGFLGDRIGRKKVFLIGIVLLIVCGFGMAIAPHWTIFGILRIGVGFAHPGWFKLKSILILLGQVNSKDEVVVKWRIPTGSFLVTVHETNIYLI